MAELDKPLAGMSALIIDMSDSMPTVRDAFVAAGAKVIVASDEESLKTVEAEALPNVAVIRAGSLEFRRIRYFAIKLLDQRECLSLIYDDQFPYDEPGDYGGDVIHRSRPVEEVVAAAVRGLPGVSTRH